MCARAPSARRSGRAPITVRLGGTGTAVLCGRARRRDRSRSSRARTGAIRDRAPETGLHGSRIAVVAVTVIATAVIATGLNRSRAADDESGAAIRPSMNEFLAAPADNRRPELVNGDNCRHAKILVAVGRRAA